MDSLSDTLAHMTLEDEPELWLPYDMDTGTAPWHYDPPVYSEWRDRGDIMTTPGYILVPHNHPLVPRDIVPNPGRRRPRPMTSEEIMWYVLAGLGVIYVITNVLDCPTLADGCPS